MGFIPGWLRGGERRNTEPVQSIRQIRADEPGSSGHTGLDSGTKRRQVVALGPVCTKPPNN